MDDERVIRRTALGLVDPAYCVRVQGICAKAVDRLRRDGHQSAIADDLRRLGDLVRLGAGIVDLPINRFHAVMSLLSDCSSAPPGQPRPARR